MNNRNELDEAIANIHNEQPSDEIVKAAAGRVFRNLFDANFIAAPQPTGKIRSCADMRALIPAYLDHTLTSPRRLLVEDHMLTCIECRHALQEARTGAPTVRPIPINRPQRKRIPALAWAAAAVLLVGIGLGLTGHFPGQNVVNAQVASLQGTLYKVTDIGVSLVKVGDILNNTDELRTAKGAHAILRLAGGTMVEIAERSQVSLSSGWRSTSLNLSRGRMILDTHGHLQNAVYVNSGDMTVPITDGIVAVNHGTKDSRVAVAQGSVDISSGSATHRISAGQQYGAHLQLVNFPINSEFAWSEHAAAYNDLLNQLTGLQKDIQALPAPGLRYTSNIPQYLPADTFLYVAVPNLGGTITEAKKLFDSRLSESEALRQWWQQTSVSKNGAFDHIVDQISSISSYLGDEIVVSVAGAASGSEAAPVFMAEIKQPGLADYLQANLPADAHVQIVSAGSPAPADGKYLLIDLDNNILVATTSATQLQRIEAVIQKTAPGGFTATPFYARIGKVYQNGAATFLAANLEQITSKSVTNSKTAVPDQLGLNNVEYLVLERKNGGELRASVSFNGARQGVASWLAAPGPTGSLNFVSPDANFAASTVMKNPQAMMRELLGMASANDPNFTQGLNDFEAKAGVSLVSDVAAPLGNDFTIAMDGPLNPILAVEVFDPNHLQQTLTAFITKFNQQSAGKMGTLSLSSGTPVNGRTFFSITSSKAPNFGAWYTFVDGYLVAASSQGNLVNAITNEQTGHTLTSSPAFRAQLPADGYANFSAMLYTNLGSLGSLAQQFSKSSKQKAVTGFLANSGPALICVYGENDHITAATKGSFMGFDLGALIGLQQGKPMHSMIASIPIGAKKEILN
jgi:ferric-dicitrate binding protein FerR (iron transport regulator)